MSGQRPSALAQWIDRLKQSAEQFGVSALVSLVISAVVSGVATVYFESRLENSKEHVAALIRQREQFDTSQNNIFTQIGSFTEKVFNKGDLSGKEKLQSAILEAQLQLNRLKNELPKDSGVVFSDYEGELDNLSRGLRSVSGPNDLRPVFISAQKILELHEKVAEQVKKNLNIRIF